MNRELVSSILVQPHLLAYLRWKENLGPEDKLSLEYCQGDVAYALGGILTTKMIALQQVDRKLPKKYSERLEVLITPRLFGESRIHVSVGGTVFFNRFLHKNMHALLLDRIIQGKKHKVQAKETMLSFIDEIGAKDLISFDAIDKASDRLRKSLEIAPFRSLSCRNGGKQEDSEGARTGNGSNHAA
jgi:hypothetical protein